MEQVKPGHHNKPPQWEAWASQLQSSPNSLQLEKVLKLQWRASAAKNKFLKKMLKGNFRTTREEEGMLLGSSESVLQTGNPRRALRARAQSRSTFRQMYRKVALPQILLRCKRGQRDPITHVRENPEKDSGGAVPTMSVSLQGSSSSSLSAFWDLLSTVPGRATSIYSSHLLTDTELLPTKALAPKKPGPNFRTSRSWPSAAALRNQKSKENKQP